MKILFITAGLKYGGAERVMSILSSEFSKLGHDVGIYLTQCDSECVYPLHEKIKVYTPDSHVNKFNIVFKLRKFIKAHDPDVVIPFLPFQCIFTVFACLFSKYPVIVCERNDPNIIDADHTGRFWFWLRDFAYSLSKGAIFQTEGAKSYFSKKIREKSVVILNPFDTSQFGDRFTGVRDGRVVTVGRITHQKNHALLIRAFANIEKDYPDSILEIYGTGPLEKDLNDLVCNLGLENRVRFMGNVSNVGDNIRTASCFAFSSDYEGLPNALIEAMCIGIPCVSTDCSPGGARMIIENEENGLLVDVGDTDQLSSAISKILSDKEFSDTCSRNAILFKDKVELNTITSAWISYINSIL